MNDDTTNETPEDDTEGHGRYGHVKPADEDNDAEGHRFKRGIQPAGEDDAEGHRYVPRGERDPIGEVPEPSNDDAEGHGRFRF